MGQERRAEPLTFIGGGRAEMNGFKRLLAFAALAPLLLHADVVAAQPKVIEVRPPEHRTPVFAAGYEGDFTQVREAKYPDGSKYTYQTKGHLVWLPFGADEGPDDLPPLPALGRGVAVQNYVPRGGTITVTIDYEFKHPNGNCTGHGEHTFAVNKIPKSAWKNSNLQVSKDRYVLNLVLSGDSVPFKMHTTCKIAGRSVPDDPDVNDAYLELQDQRGDIAHGGVTGETKPPIRQPFNTITGTWTFVPRQTGAR
jgi:hypothetical protein